MTDLEERARISIERSGFKTKDDVYAVMGGDIKALNDPLVQKMIELLPEET